MKSFNWEFNTQFIGHEEELRLRHEYELLRHMATDISELNKFDLKPYDKWPYHIALELHQNEEKVAEILISECSGNQSAADYIFYSADNDWLPKFVDTNECLALVNKMTEPAALLTE